MGEKSQPLISEGPPDPSDMKLSDLEAFLERFADDSSLEKFLSQKLAKNQLSFPIPLGDEITALTKMQDGFVVGLRSGKLMLVAPPIAKTVDLGSEVITGLFAASNYFVLIGFGHSLQAWEPAKWTLLCREDYPDTTTVTFICGSMLKETIFIGLSTGEVEQLHIQEKEKADISVKFTFVKPGEPSGVSDIKTCDSTLWVAVRYKSNELTLWDHEMGHLLYMFSFDGSAGLPSSFALGESKALPRFFSPAEGWEVFPQLIIFSSLLVLRMSGNAISAAHSARRKGEPDAEMWLAYGEALQKGYLPFLCGNHLISFTPPGAEKKKPSEKAFNEIELAFSEFFTLAERSEADNYLAFACEQSLEVICLAAVETKFSHRPAGPIAVSKQGSAVYSRLGSFYTSSKELVKPCEPRELILFLSPDGKWLVTQQRPSRDAPVDSSPLQLHRREESKFIEEARWSQERSGSLERMGTVSVDEPARGRGRARGLGRGRFRRGRVGAEHRQSRATAEEPSQILITSLQAPFESVDLQEWSTKQFLQCKFSTNGHGMALLFRDGLLIYSFESRCIKRTIIDKFTNRGVSIKNLTEGAYLVTGKGWYWTVGTVETADGAKEKYEYDRMALIKGEGSTEENAIAYSMEKTCLGKFSGTQFLQGEHHCEGFEQVKVISHRAMFVGANDSGVSVYRRPQMEKLFRVPNLYSVTLCSDAQFMYALCMNPQTANAWMIDVWDLEVGLKVRRLASGLRFVQGNRLQVKGPGMWQEPRFRLISRQASSAATFRETWTYDLSRMRLTAESLLKCEESCLSMYEESLERQCIAWRQLANMLRRDEIPEETLTVLLKPYDVNILHLLANRNHAGMLAAAMEMGCPVLKSSFGTPLAIAIERKARKCTNAILLGLSNLRESKPSAFLMALFQTQDDLSRLISDNPPGLAEFLQAVVVPLPEEMAVQSTISPASELPITRMTSDLWVSSSSFASADRSASNQQTVEYLVCPFPFYVEVGSEPSISILNELVNGCNDMNVHKTLVIKTLIDMKWNQIWWFIFTSTVLYWTLLGIMICIMLKYVEGWAARGTFALLNTWFLVIELLQVLMHPCDYVKEYWNYVDLTRTALSYVWVASDFEAWLTFMVVLLSLLRGITTFQTFSATRFYVRMVFVVTHETMSFLWVFFYSTLSFGLLLATVNPQVDMDFFHTWTIPYELNMGNFDVDGKGHWYWLVFMIAALVNVIIMLNLVVSILGDAYDKFQTISEAADVMGKAEVLFEHERMMWWKRGSGTAKYLQICRSEGGTDSVEEWAGKVEELKKELRKVETRLVQKLANGLAKVGEEAKEARRENSLMEKMDDVKIALETKLGGIRELVKTSRP